MIKKLIIINSLIVSFSLIVTVLISILIFTNENYNSTAVESKKYLSLASNIFDGDNSDELIAYFNEADSNIRITIIDFEGNVINDSHVTDLVDSHLDRWEIQNLNQAYIRYSENLDCNMAYIACVDDGYYLRISIPIKSINAATTTFISISIVTLVIMLTLSIFLIHVFSKKTTSSINQEINTLALLADKDEFINASIDDLSKIIEGINGSLNDKINKISVQKEELLDVINKISSGVLVIDKSSILTLINETALNIFQMDIANVINKEYIYLIRDMKIQKLITLSLNNHENNEGILEQGNKCYKVIISYINSSWIHHGLIVIIRDITQMISLDKTKREFFANASHELKSPLTSIIGYQQLITEGIETNIDNIIDYSKLTLKEARRMNDIVIDMLNLSKLERKEAIHNEIVNCKYVIIDILESFTKRIELSKLKVNLDIIDVNLNIDRNLAYQLFKNLIDNAIKYNNKNGFINIILNEKLFSIEDNGIGIESNEQIHIFERFYRVDKAKSKALGGTGLGLAIVKHICEEYGFKISLKSNLGVGTKIEIKFKELLESM